MRYVKLFCILLVFGLVCFLPAPKVSAHSGHELSAWAVVTPTIDGTISAGEWDDADMIWVNVMGNNGEHHTLKILEKNDATNLYLAVQVDDEYSDPDEMGYDFLNFYFDNNHDGATQIGEDGLAIRYDGAIIEDTFNPTGTMGWSYSDQDYGGTNDLVGAITHTNPVDNGWGMYTAEYQHPLDTADDSHDFSLSGGDYVGFKFVLADGDPFPGPSGHFDWPSTVPSGYAHIIIKSTPSTNDIADAIDDLPDDAFKNNPAQRKNALRNKLEAAQNKIDEGDYDGAIDKLLEIRAKMDGCFGGNPSNDWIVDCDAQAQILALIDTLIAYLVTL